MSVPTAEIAFGLEVPGHTHLDNPIVEFAGWACSPTGEEFTDMRALLDGRPALGLYGLVRPDIGQLYPGHAATRTSGFRVWIRPWLGA